MATNQRTQTTTAPAPAPAPQAGALQPQGEQKPKEPLIKGPSNAICNRNWG